MTKDQVIKILTDYNKWRRGAEMPQPDPKEIGIAIQTAIKLLKQC